MRLVKPEVAAVLLLDDYRSDGGHGAFAEEGKLMR
jgi:hypothetical protein